MMPASSPTPRSSEKNDNPDFKTELLLVYTALGPNVPSVKLYEARGSVTAHVSQTVLGGNGFGYRILKIPRKGIHTVAGQKID